MKSKRLALITSVALPFMASAPAMAIPAFGGLDAGSSNPIAAAPPLILAQTPEELLLLEQQRQQQQQQEQQQQEEPPPPPPQQAEPPPPPPEPPAPPPEPPPPPPEAAPPVEPPPPPPPEVQAPPPEPPAPPPEPAVAPPEPPPPPPIETPPAPEPAPPPPVLEQTPTEPPVLNPPTVEPPAVETPAPPVPRLETPPSTEAPPSPSTDTPPPPPTLEPPPAGVEPPPPAGGPPPVDNPPAAGAPSAPVLPPPGAEPGTGAQPPAADGAQTAAPPPAEESAVESQLEAQGDQQAVDNVRTLRAKLREEQARGRDGDGERPGEGRGGDGPRPDEGQSPGDDGPGRDGDGPGRDGPGRDGDRDRDGRWERERPPESDIVVDLGGRFIIRFGDQVIIRQDDAYESDRFLDRARDVDVEHFRGGYSRTTVTRGDGSQIITVRDRYGEIMTRTRIDPRGRQVILIDNREFYRDGRRPRYTRFEDELPPLRIGIPQEQYIVEASRGDRDTIYAALMAPPVEAIERPYALDEIRMSERLRNKMPRVDLNTITFDFGSAAITPSQFDALTATGQAMEQALGENPDLIFLIEGHTDAVGSDNDNLVLSDQRAEAIAVALSSNFNIPPENLVPQGYGEQYLKVPTDGPEQQNRRVTVRNITELAQGS